MSNVTSTPRRIGASLSTADSDTLAALDPHGLTLGTKCWNVDVGAYFTLSTSTASLDPDVVVDVDGLTGARWLVDTNGTSVATDDTLSGDGSAETPLGVVQPTSVHKEVTDSPYSVA